MQTTEVHSGGSAEGIQPSCSRYKSYLTEDAAAKNNLATIIGCNMSVKILKSNLHDFIQVGQHLMVTLTNSTVVFEQICFLLWSLCFLLQIKGESSVPDWFIVSYWSHVFLIKARDAPR